MPSKCVWKSLEGRSGGGVSFWRLTSRRGGEAEAPSRRLMELAERKGRGGSKGKHRRGERADRTAGRTGGLTSNQLTHTLSSGVFLVLRAEPLLSSLRVLMAAPATTCPPWLAS